MMDVGCLICNGKHLSYKCPLPRQEKFEKVKINRLCFRCLNKFNSFHVGCRRGERCKCGKNFNISICPCEGKTTMNFHNQTNNATMATNDFSSNNQIDHVAISSTNETKTFLSVLELWAIYKNKKQKIYALLDGCATVSSISQNLANNLKVQTTVEKGMTNLLLLLLLLIDFNYFVFFFSFFFLIYNQITNKKN